jgi:hypothetical protein
MPTHPVAVNKHGSQGGHFESYVTNFPGIRRPTIPTYARVAFYTTQHGVTTMCNNRLADELHTTAQTIRLHIKNLATLGLVLPVFCKHGNNRPLKNFNRGAARWLLTHGSHFRTGFLEALDQCATEASLWHESSFGEPSAESKQASIWRFLALQEKMFPGSTVESAEFVSACGVVPPVEGVLGTGEFNTRLWEHFDKLGEMPALKKNEIGRSSQRPKGPFPPAPGSGGRGGDKNRGVSHLKKGDCIEFLSAEERNRISKQGTPTQVAEPTREAPTQTGDQFGGSNFSFLNSESEASKPEACERALQAAQSPGVSESIQPEVAALIASGDIPGAKAKFYSEATGFPVWCFSPMPNAERLIELCGGYHIELPHPFAKTEGTFACVFSKESVPCIDYDQLSDSEYETMRAADKRWAAIEAGFAPVVAPAPEAAPVFNFDFMTAQLRKVVTRTSAGSVRCCSRLGRLLGSHTDAEAVVAGLEEFLGSVTKWPRQWQVNLRHRLTKNQINLQVFENLRANMDAIMSWKNLLVYDTNEKIDNFKIALSRLAQITSACPVRA